MSRDHLNDARMQMVERHVRFAVDAIEIQMDHDVAIHTDTAPRDIAFARYLLICDTGGDEILSVHDDLDVACDAASGAGRIIDLDTGRAYRAA